MSEPSAGFWADFGLGVGLLVLVLCVGYCGLTRFFGNVTSSGMYVQRMPPDQEQGA